MRDGEGLMLIFNEDGIAELYDDTYDITIHCTSKEEQEKVLKILESYGKEGVNHGI